MNNPKIIGAEFTMILPGGQREEVRMMPLNIAYPVDPYGVGGVRCQVTLHTTGGDVNAVIELPRYMAAFA